MVNILAPVIAKALTYVKPANFPGLYRHARFGKYHACKKLGDVRRERSLGTCDRKIAERRLKEWIGNLDKLDAEVEKPTLGQLLERSEKVNSGASHAWVTRPFELATAAAGRYKRRRSSTRGFIIILINLVAS